MNEITEPSEPMTSEPVLDGTSAHGATLAKTATGTAWVVAWRMASRTLGLISTIVLVRLLNPADFGLIALASSFAQSIEAFTWFGIEDALVREKAPSRSSYDTAFTMGLIRAAALATIVAAAAYPAARFFNEPRLAVVILSLAGATLFEGISNVGVVDFRRHFNFDQEFKLQILPRVCSTTAAIVSAIILRSYWALVIGVVLSRVLRVIAGYVMHPYRPHLSLREWRSLTSYTFWNWLWGLAAAAASQLDTFMLGRLLNTTNVGLYAVGGEIALLPQTELVEPLSRTTFSAFSEARRQEQNPAQIWLRIASASALLVIPAGVGISLVAHNLILVFFGAAWTPSVAVAQMVSLGVVVSMFGTVSSCMFQAYGQLRLLVYLKVLLIAVRVALLFVLLPRYGLVGAGLAVLFSAMIEQVAQVTFAFRQMGESLLGPLIARTWRCLASVAVMAGGLTVAGYGWGGDFTGIAPILGLFGASAAGAALYALSLGGLWALSGRPHGPEADLLDMAGRTMIKIRRMIRSLFTRNQPGLPDVG